MLAQHPYVQSVCSPYPTRFLSLSLPPFLHPPPSLPPSLPQNNVTQPLAAKLLKELSSDPEAGAKVAASLQEGSGAALRSLVRMLQDKDALQNRAAAASLIAALPQNDTKLNQTLMQVGGAEVGREERRGGRGIEREGGSLGAEEGRGGIMGGGEEEGKLVSGGWWVQWKGRRQGLHAAALSLARFLRPALPLHPWVAATPRRSCLPGLCSHSVSGR